MSDMRRLRDETRSPFARALLESAEGERPDSGACDRALGALGIGAVGAGVVATSTAAKAASAVVASAGVGASASQVTSVAAKGGTLYLVKWIGIGILGSAAVIGSASYVQREASTGAPRTIASTQTSLRPSFSTEIGGSAGIIGGPGDRSAPRTPAPVAPIASSASRPATRSTTPIESPAARASAKPLAETVSIEPQSPGLPAHVDSLRGPSAESSATNAESVTTQLAALSGVRAALAAHDADRALALLGAIEARNPSSPFAEEIAVLRIDALTDAHRIDEASALARAFVVRYPSSAYGEHVRSKTKIP